MKHFHFTLGPVQGFVAQARRIQDFWAGSFLLSWLSAVAMRSVEAQGGEIEFPAYDENYMAWIGAASLTSTSSVSGVAPRQGGVPNRFMACIPAHKVNDFSGEKVRKAVFDAWKALANEVWNADLAHLEKSENTETKKIWHRQIEHFWEISWVLTDKDDDTAMDRRKNWRNYALPVEEGLPCSLMEGWVELSGKKQPGAAIRNFWQPLREKLGRDLNEREQLCAIAFVKRRFVKVFHDVKVNMGGWTCHGWDLRNQRIASTNDMAAVHWLEQVLKHGDDKLLEEIASQAGQLKTPKIEYKNKNGEVQISEGKYIERHGEKRIHPICCIEQAYECNANTTKGQVAHLNGVVFFEHALRNSKLYEPNSIVGMLQALKAVREAGKQPLRPLPSTELVEVNGNGRKDGAKVIDKPQLPTTPPSPYYAILLMDGDNMGQALRDGNPKTISQALLKFNKATDDLVYTHNGFLIYAGGDDVLALLPVEDALNCAYQLHEAYAGIMCAAAPATTLSGAIQFAHVKTPLTLLLQDAHKLLDKVAKKEHGRDSLAVRVWNHGGQGLEWAMPWSCAVEGDKMILQTLLEDLQKKDQEGGQFSSGFFYKIREFFQQNKELTVDVLQALLVSAYLASSKSGDKDLNTAKQQVERLFSQCKRLKRNATSGECDAMELAINPDGALLLRFLAQHSVSMDKKKEIIDGEL